VKSSIRFQQFSVQRNEKHLLWIETPEQPQGKWDSRSVEGNGNLKWLPIWLFLFSNNVVLKNINRNYRKTFRFFWVREEMQYIF